jgi:thiol-disulfide isomerase/thioredoxin
MNTVGFGLLLTVLVAATLFGVWRMRTDGRLQVERTSPNELGAADLGVALGPSATLVQFSSAFCAPCRATRQLLGEVSTMVDGVQYVDIDAEANLELVRRLDIRRTPTVLVLDRAGRIVKRAAGQPRKADLVAALGDVL